MNPDDLIIGETYLHVPTQSRVEVDGVQSPMHGDAFVNIMGSAGQVKLGAVKASELRILRHRTPLLTQLERVSERVRNEDAEAVDHPAHYGGDTTYEAIKVIEAWGLGFALGNTTKYIARAGKKDPAAEVQDLRKAAFYLDRRIQQLEAGE